MPEPHFEPNACRWCGVPQRGHFQLWKPPVGWHTFTEPTDAQRLARMRARQAARLAKPAPVPEPCIVTLKAGVSEPEAATSPAARKPFEDLLTSQGIDAAELDRIRAGILALGEPKED